MFPALILLQSQAPGRVPSRIGGLPGDSISLRQSPLPGGIADVVRRIFDAPQPLQIAAVVVGILILAGLVAIAWWQRAELLSWFTNRPRRHVLAAGVVAAAVVGVAGWFSVRSWNYMQHDNAFCSGCHVMAPAWTKFQTTKHAQLSCHQCHQQSIFASARQLVLWVADRPGQIPAHSKVPNARCIACHVNSDSTRWKQIAATEGHRLHLESPKLKGLQCVRCHGFSVHQFVPTDMTCGQAGCHTNIRIRLGKMSNVTSLHCAMCHAFTRRAAAPMSVSDSLRRWLTPTRVECFNCHAMRKLMVDQQLAHDPHGAVCGACHNPHTQTSAAQAVRSCMNCHTHPETLTAFHRGIAPSALASCTSCHQPHSWKTAGAGNCTNCHGDIFKSGPAATGRVSALMPWGRLHARLLAAMRTSDPVAAFASGRVPARTPPAPRRPDVSRLDAGTAARVPVFRLISVRLAQQPQQPGKKPPRKHPTTSPGVGATPAPVTAAPPGPMGTGPFRGFSHAVHRNVACTSCHSMRTEHGLLLIRSAEDCMACHHSSRAGVTCTRCHQPGELPQGRTRTLTVSTSTAPAPATRTLPFNHADHPGIACTSCHTSPPTYTQVRSCTECHADHHTSARDCVRCHQSGTRDLHPVSAHLTCGGAGCHRDAPVNALVWSRPVCLACHQDMARHEAGRSCAECHAVPALHAPPPARLGQ